MVSEDTTKGEPRELSQTSKALIGGLCSMITTALVHPLDVMKVRMQVYPSAKTTTEMAGLILRCEGIPALYAGLSAGIMRQATYTTTRLGVYYWLYEEYKHNKLKPTVQDKIVIGTYAGLLSAFAGNPSEVALIRMMADGKRAPCGGICESQKRYRGVFDAFYKIYQSEGVKALWRGGALTVTRSALVTITQLSSYLQASETLKRHKLAEGRALHVYCSAISSFFTAIVSLPVDLIKTRYQNKNDDNSQMQIFDDIVKNNGIKYFWKGFMPYFCRLTIHTALTYLIVEEVRERYFNYLQLISK